MALRGYGRVLHRLHVRSPCLSNPHGFSAHPSVVLSLDFAHIANLQLARCLQTRLWYLGFSSCALHPSPSASFYGAREGREFTKRALQCTERVWTCSITGKSGLNYREALQVSAAHSPRTPTYPHTAQQPFQPNFTTERYRHLHLPRAHASGQIASVSDVVGDQKVFSWSVEISGWPLSADELWLTLWTQQTHPCPPTRPPTHLDCA